MIYNLSYDGLDHLKKQPLVRGAVKLTSVYGTISLTSLTKAKIPIIEPAVATTMNTIVSARACLFGTPRRSVLITFCVTYLITFFAAFFCPSCSSTNTFPSAMFAPCVPSQNAELRPDVAHRE